MIVMAVGMLYLLWNTSKLYIVGLINYSDVSLISDHTYFCLRSMHHKCIIQSTHTIIHSIKHLVKDQKSSNLLRMYVYKLCNISWNCSLTTKPLWRLISKSTTTIQTTAISAVDSELSQNAAAIITLTTTGRLVIKLTLNVCMSYSSAIVWYTHVPQRVEPFIFVLINIMYFASEFIPFSLSQQVFYAMF